MKAWADLPATHHWLLNQLQVLPLAASLALMYVLNMYFQPLEPAVGASSAILTASLFRCLASQLQRLERFFLCSGDLRSHVAPFDT